MPRLTADAREQVRTRLAGLSAAAKRRAVEDLADEYGVSAATIYRAGRSPGTTRRAGSVKKPLAREVLHYMVGLTVQADFSAQHAIDQAAIHFGLPPDFCSVSRYNLLLRQKRLSRRETKQDLKPYHPFEASKPNRLHQYDTTVAAAWFERDNGAIGFEPEERRYKNRPGNKKPRLHVYSLIDDHSRVLYARIYRSENRHNLIRFFRWCWTQQDDRRWPAFGLPEELYADKGSPLEAKRTREALEKLGVAVVPTPSSYSTRHGARKHGKVERTFGAGILGEWQKITRVQQFTSLEELNAALYEWLILRNNRRHSATGEAPFARWLRGHITPRTAPSEDVWEEFHYDRDTRVVSQRLTVSIGNREYQLPFRRPCVDWVGQRVEVYYRRDLQKGSVTVCSGGDEIEAPLFADADITQVGTYREIPKTGQEEEIEKAEAQRYGPARPTRADAPAYIAPKAGSGPTLDGHHTPDVTINQFQVLDLLRDFGLVSDGTLTQEDKDLWRTAMGGQQAVPKRQVEKAIRILQDAAIARAGKGAMGDE